MTGWKWAAARRRGTSHVKSGLPCQDAFRCVGSGRTGIVAVVCDGAGSAAYGGAGAALVSRTRSQLALRHLNVSSRVPDDELIWDWIDACRDRIAHAAKRKLASPRDFATTLVCAIVLGEETVLLLIGDGAAAVYLDGAWMVPSWPEHGEYASTTYFLTDDPTPRLRIVRLGQPVTAIALMSDGLERLALDFTNKLPHGPFFAGIIRPIVELTSQGWSYPLSCKLGQYLDGDAINARTDDDKTIVLAARS